MKKDTIGTRDTFTRKIGRGGETKLSRAASVGVGWCVLSFLFFFLKTPPRYEMRKHFLDTGNEEEENKEKDREKRNGRCLTDGKHARIARMMVMMRQDEQLDERGRWCWWRRRPISTRGDRNDEHGGGGGRTVGKLEDGEGHFRSYDCRFLSSRSVSLFFLFSLQAAAGVCTQTASLSFFRSASNLSFSTFA